MSFGVSPGDLQEALRVGDDERGRAPETVERVAQFALLDDDAVRVVVEHVADGVDLRQDQPAFGRFEVNRHDQHHQFAGRDQVAEDRGRVDEILRRGADQRLAQVQDAFPRAGDGRDPRDFPRLQLGDRLRVRRREVRLVEHDHDRRFPRGQLGQDALLERAPGRRLGDDQAEVGPVEHLPRPLHAQFAERADVVNARRVNEQHRPDRQQLHRLLDRVGGRAGHVGDDRDVLPRQAVQQRRLADVAPAEDADVQPEAFGGASQLSVFSRSGCPSRMTRSGEMSWSNSGPLTKPRSMHDLADALSVFARGAGDFGRGLVPDPLGERGEDGGGAFDVAAAARLVRLEPGDAEPPEDRAGVPQQVQAAEQGVGDQRQERVQLQAAERARLRDGLVVGHHRHRRLRDRLRDDRVDLSGHDRGAGLPLGDAQLADPRVRPGGEQPDVRRDLEQVRRRTP